MVTAAEIEGAIKVLKAYWRGDLADDQTINDDLYDALSDAIEAAYEQVESPAPPMVVSA